MPVFFANLTTNSLKEPVLNVRADITELLQPLPCRSIYPVIPVLVSCWKSMSLTACFRDPQRRGYSALEDDSRQNQHNSVTLITKRRQAEESYKPFLSLAVISIALPDGEVDFMTLPVGSQPRGVKWREASATPSMASITSTDESFQYHGDLHQHQRDHYHHDHHHNHHPQTDQQQYAHDRDSPANSSKMSANLLDSCL
ncbi:hypothetical protein RRG08_057147 [Elysia crispata]|uniref:Uncharacterized protein n=1 Tax=Elysia crispata TaxID=231223 RepID=A0AAE1E3S8_9GAST|nr:hypothetical protein RRG08_057147 [Elysia crispata]